MAFLSVGWREVFWWHCTRWPQEQAGELWDWLTQVFFWQWWSWYSHSSMYVIYQLTFFCLWEQRGRPARRQFLWEDSTGAFQLYPERYLVATTVNPGSDKWMKRNSNNRRSFYVSPWFFYLYLDLFHLVPTFSPLDMSSYRKVIRFKYSLLLTFF